MGRRLDDVNFHRDLANDERRVDDEEFQATLDPITTSKPATAPKAVEPYLVRRHLHSDLPAGMKIVPDEKLDVKRRKARALSIGTAIAKHKARRARRLRYW